MWKWFSMSMFDYQHLVHFEIWTCPKGTIQNFRNERSPEPRLRSSTAALQKLRTDCKITQRTMTLERAERSATHHFWPPSPFSTSVLDVSWRIAAAGVSRHIRCKLWKRTAFRTFFMVISSRDCVLSITKRTGYKWLVAILQQTDRNPLLQLRATGRLLTDQYQ